MKRKIYCFLSLLFLFTCSSLYGQDDNYAKENIIEPVPVSPNAASLGIFGAVPVGHYTGVPNISIPLYEIDLDGMKFPVKLAYHASGIKVAQEASSVGLGWALIAGGCITHEVKHLDDFDLLLTNGYYWDTNFPTPGTDNGLNTAYSSETYDHYVTSRKDAEPDLFHFTFGNYSGSCFFDKVGTGNNTNLSAEAILLNTKEYLQITYDIPANKWVIYDGYGYKYVFADRETSEIYAHTFSSPSGIGRDNIRKKECSPITTAWHLTEIISPQQNSVKFYYEAEKIFSQVHTSEDKYYQLDLRQDIYQGKGFISTNLMGVYSYYSASYSIMDQLLLKKIDFGTGTMDLEYSSRTDIEHAKAPGPTAKKVDSINVSDKIGNTIKKIRLGHSYFNAGSFLSGRLKLDNVYFINPLDGRTEQTYSFKYNNGILPAKNSRYTDYWGYYNGVGGGISTVKTFLYSPSVRVDYYNSRLNKFTSEDISGVRKKAVNSFAQYGILKSIVYPTGGSTFFEYELHDYNNTYVDDFETVRPVGVEVSTYILGHETKVSDTFEIVDNTTVNVTVKYHSKGLNEKGINVEMELQKYNKSRDRWDLFERYTISHTLGHRDYENSLPKELPAGIYRMELKEYHKGENDEYDISGKVEFPLLKVKSQEGGGLRIKSIEDYSDGIQVSKREFTYKKNGVSTGILMNRPCHHYYLVLDDQALDVRRGYPINNAMWKGYYINGTSTSYNPLMASAAGGYVGYSYVEESNTTNNINKGYSVYTFHNTQNIVAGAGYINRGGYPTIPDLNNGAPLTIAHYDSDGKIIKNQTFTYSRIGRTSVKGLITYRPPMILKQPVASVFWGKYYDLFYERWLLTTKQETDYYQDGRAVTTVTEYGYNNQNFRQNYEKTTLNGDLYETHIKYPVDYTDAVHRGMTQRHMVDMPIEKITSRNGSVVQAEKKEFALSSGMYLPQAFYSLDTDAIITTSAVGGSHYSRDILCSAYNSYGKISEFSGRDNVKVVYLWSYKSRYPVAEIRNATYQEVANLLGTAFIETLASANVPTAAQFNSVENLRASLPNAMVTTYTYKPLVGVTRITDPAGKITMYDYDPVGRLAEVAIKKDAQSAKEVLETYQYNFQK